MNLNKRKKSRHKQEPKIPLEERVVILKEILEEDYEKDGNLYYNNVVEIEHLSGVNVEMYGKESYGKFEIKGHSKEAIRDSLRKVSLKVKYGY